MKNPFNPSFGTIPEIFIDRDDLVRKLSAGVQQHNSPYQTILLTGIRGVGKTALLTEICQKVQEEKEWIVVRVDSPDNVIQQVVTLIDLYADSEFVKILRAIDGFSFNVAGTGVSITSEKRTCDERYMLEKVLMKMKEKGKHLLIAIDEVCCNESMKKFASIYQVMLGLNYPVSCIMAGLAKNISELQNDKILTFLLRSMRIDLPMLSDVKVYYTYKKLFAERDIELDDGVLKTMTEITKGYSYAFQLLGFLLWEIDLSKVTDESIDQVLDDYKRILFRTAYSKIFHELSRIDRKFVLAAVHAECPSISMK